MPPVVHTSRSTALRWCYDQLFQPELMVGQHYEYSTHNRCRDISRSDAILSTSTHSSVEGQRRRCHYRGRPRLFLIINVDEPAGLVYTVPMLLNTRGIIKFYLLL